MKQRRKADSDQARSNPEETDVFGAKQALESGDELADLADAVTEYGAAASALAEACNVPPASLLDLCRALQHAWDAYDDVRCARARTDSMRSNQKAAKAFHRAMTQACKEWGSLDVDTRVTISRTVAAKHEAAFFDTGMRRLGQIEIESRERRLGLEQLFAETADAAEKCIEQAKRSRGTPPDKALRAFVAVLRQFWVEKLGRAFCDQIEEDFEFSSDPDRGDYVPANDASRFVVKAVQLLISDEVTVGTCRWMMRVVNDAT